MRVQIRRLIAVCSAIAGALLVAPAKAGPPFYRAVGIHGLSRASAISDAGHVVGWSLLTDGPAAYPHAYLWHNGVLHDLDPEGIETRASRAYGVNSQGHVVGRFFDDGEHHLFLWLPAPAFNLPAGFNDLGALDANRSSVATDINERSEIVGTTGHTVFLWLPNQAFGLPSGMHDLCDDWPIDNDCPHSVNARINHLAQVLADEWVWLPQPAYGRPRGWWHFHQSGNNDYVFAQDLNGTGSIVATGYVFEDSYFAETNLWDDQQEVICCEFGKVLGDGYGVAINEAGIMIGGLWLDGAIQQVLVDGTFFGENRWWTLDDRMLYRNARSSWRAVDISNTLAIVANAVDKAGSEHSIVLFPIDTDVDGYGRTNLYDVSFFQFCLSGPSVNPPFLCDSCDLEEDNDVDLSDFQALQLGFEGGF